MCLALGTNSVDVPIDIVKSIAIIIATVLFFENCMFFYSPFFVKKHFRGSLFKTYAKV